MIKSVIKEIFIIILLIVAIILVLGIIFYDYRPTTKQIPSVVEGYSLPEEMKQELDETIQVAGTQNIVETYRVDGSDLDGFEKSDDYKPGKINPFDKISTSDENADQNNSNANNTTSNGNSQGNFLNVVK